MEPEFERDALIGTYLSKGGGEYEIRGGALWIRKIESKKYDEVIKRLEKEAVAAGQASKVSTARGDEWEALFRGALLTIVNPDGLYGFGRGLEIEAENQNGLEEVIRLLELPN